MPHVLLNLAFRVVNIMKITNNTNIPQYLLPWVVDDKYDYNPNILSATSLLKPAREVVLVAQNQDVLTIDAVDLLASAIGNAIHSSIERALIAEGVLCETRFYGTIDGVTISGKPDFILDGIVHDIKTTSTWTFIYGSRNEDYIRQLSIYKWLLKQAGIDTESYGIIDMVFTDWSRAKALQGGGYPEKRIASFSLDLMNESDIILFIRERLSAINSAYQSLPDCTPEELWSRPDTWAVKKKNNVRATKVFDVKSEAEEFALTNKDFEVECRKGSVNRCKYCMARIACEQAVRLEEQELLEKE